MRYTLRLLTLDQLARAAGLVCALELEREDDPDRYGTWPFEIGLWVGKAATPNVMGRKGDGRSDTRASRGAAVQGRPAGQAVADPAREVPVVRDALQRGVVLAAPRRRPAARAADRLHELRVRLHARSAAADRGRGRADLPAAAGVPDRDRRQVRGAAVGRSVGCAARRREPARRDRLLRRRRAGHGHAAAGAAAAARPRDPGRAAPDLGPARHDGRPLRDGDRGAVRARARRPASWRPKIVASTATVRRAQDQIQALFARATHADLPAARARTAATRSSRARCLRRRRPARLYLGVAAPGPQPEGRDAQGVARADGRGRALLPRRRRPQERGEPGRPVHDGARLLQQPARAGRRAADPRGGGPEHGQGVRRATRIGEQPGLFQDRRTFTEVVELTSRVSTDKVAEARRRLGTPFTDIKQRVDCAHRDQHDLGRPRHPAARADGRARAAEDGRRVHPGDEPRRAPDDAPGPRRDAAQHPQAA